MCVKLKDIPALFVRWVARILLFKLCETPSGRGLWFLPQERPRPRSGRRRYPLEESAAPSRWGLAIIGTGFGRSREVSESRKLGATPNPGLRDGSALVRNGMSLTGRDLLALNLLEADAR